jgi:hypothetical protein
MRLSGGYGAGPTYLLAWGEITPLPRGCQLWSRYDLRTPCAPETAAESTAAKRDDGRVHGRVQEPLPGPARTSPDLPGPARNGLAPSVRNRRARLSPVGNVAYPV